MGKLAFEPRVTRAGNPVPACTFLPLLIVLTSAVAEALKKPADALRLIEMAVQHVTEELPRRRKEELERSSPVKESERWTRLRFRYTRRNAKLLKEAVWSQAAQPPPLGPAMRSAAGAVDALLSELNTAYDRALPLGDESLAPSKVEALPDLDLPDNEPLDEEVRNVNYDDILSK